MTCFLEKMSRRPAASPWASSAVSLRQALPDNRAPESPAGYAQIQPAALELLPARCQAAAAAAEEHEETQKEHLSVSFRWDKK
mmetsp:Transcript_146872/g.273526  ORF Transcript_146872/g.273526 Transcript_146872/m.273526 type:complete len:83 (+) Transcript_146872:165-413(+)